MITALYARVSSDKQREKETINSQLQELNNFAEKHGLEIDKRHVYTDDGESGFYLDRPGLDALRDAARDGLFDILIVQNPDRFSRKYAYQVLLLEEFKKWDIDIRFIKQPPSDSPEQKLLLQIQGVISEYERARIIERTRRGRLYWAKQGRPVCACVPFGYKYVSRNKRIPPSIEIDKESAAIVKQIFQWYVNENINDEIIARHLTNKGVAPPKRNITYWDPSSIRFILMNETYLGTWYVNKYKKEASTGQTRPRTVKRPRNEWIGISVPSIINSDIFIRAQEIRKAGIHGGNKPLKYHETHLLRRLIVCGICNRKMTSHNNKKGYRYYWCRGTNPHRLKPNRERCPHPTVSARELDELVWKDVISLLSDPDLLLSAWEEQNQIKSNRDITTSEIEKLKQKISDGNKQRQRLLDAYEKGAIEIEELIERRNTIDEKIKNNQIKINNFSNPKIKGISITNLKKNMEEVCKSLSNGLKYMNMNDKMKLCQELIEKITVERHNVEIHYKFPVSSNFNTKRERRSSILFIILCWSFRFASLLAMQPAMPFLPSKANSLARGTNGE